MTINALNLLPVRTASCSVMGDYALKKKMTVPYSKAKKGDVVLYDFNGNGTSDHTGIIYAVKGGKIYVVEGNTSQGNNCNGGMVMKRVRVKANVNYIVRPAYTKTVTAEMVVKTALSQVGIKESPSGSNRVKYNTWFYGKEVRGASYPWCMTFVQWVFAHVIEPPKKKPTAPKPNPQGAYSGSIPKPTLKKGSKGEAVKQLQKFYEWYFSNVKFTNYGAFGAHTEAVQKAYQKAEKLTQTGVYGESSYKKALAYKKKQTNQQKLLAKMKELAWAYGTPKKKNSVKTGAPKAVCKKALKKYGWADSKAEMSDCGNNVTATVREAGVSKSFKALHGTKTPFPKTEEDFNIVIKGRKIKSGELKPADIIRYKKQNGNQHVLFYMGNGKVCEASHHNRYFAIIKDEKKYNNSKIAKISTVQVLRAKE